MNFSRVASVAVCALLAPVLLAADGSVKGSVKYDGEPPVVEKKKIDPAKLGGCPHAEIDNDTLVVDKATKGIKWAMVRIMGVKAPEPKEPFAVPTMDQKGCKFEPHAMIVPPGTDLSLLNPDKIGHNFHTTPLDATNPGFNRMMPPSDEKMVVKGGKYFVEPEIIKVQCDIHPWMTGFVVVHDPRFAAITPADGTFEIKNVPPGKYDVVIFHELGEQTVKVEVKDGAAADVGEVKFKQK